MQSYNLSGILKSGVVYSERFHQQMNTELWHDYRLLCLHFLLQFFENRNAQLDHLFSFLSKFLHCSVRPFHTTFLVQISVSFGCHIISKKIKEKLFKLSWGKSEKSITSQLNVFILGFHPRAQIRTNINSIVCSTTGSAARPFSFE